MRLTADGADAGLRADAWAARVFEVSRKRAVELLRAGVVKISGATAEPDRRIKKGDILEGDLPADPPVSIVPEPGKVPVVYRDAHVIVVDKPAGLTVHPGAGRRTGTLANILLGMGVPLAPAAGTVRPGVVHRLDKDTSGLMILALTDAAYWKLVKMIHRREVVREYMAVVHGVPSPRQGTIDAALDRDPRDGQKFAVVSTGGRRAVTHFAVDRILKDASLVRVTLETGRTHQIRVHFAALGWPVLGDRVYGGSKARTEAILRQALHAARLSFEHPVTGKRLEFTSPLPADIRALIGALS